MSVLSNLVRAEAAKLVGPDLATSVNLFDADSEKEGEELTTTVTELRARVADLEQEKGVLETQLAAEREKVRKAENEAAGLQVALRWLTPALRPVDPAPDTAAVPAVHS
jgi:outer membrane murein-binding lipoprotein Lpp